MHDAVRAPELPSGTVTFLFTDVEGSTRLLHELGPDRYAVTLADHRRIVRDAFTARGGVEVDTQGDAFFVAFPSATGALEAAHAITDGLAGGPIKVRMGLHTGTPLLTEEGYIGADVHRAARIGAAGHGGQVLVSVATVALTSSDGQGAQCFCIWSDAPADAHGGGCMGHRWATMDKAGGTIRSRRLHWTQVDSVSIIS